MEYSKTFEVSLIVFAILGSIFFLVYGTVLLILFLRVKKILSNLTDITGNTARIMEEISQRVKGWTAAVSLQKIVEKILNRKKDKDE